MFNRFRFYFGLYKEIKETPEIPEVTKFLENNKIFQKAALSFHNLKLKAWQKLDEAAFPEEYENRKYIDQNSSNQSKTQQNNYDPSKKGQSQTKRK
ncbi:hypothetical protein TTHERM_01078030 (macronuclear) [Tetrahymena thermophila SB210]|uniref:Uncharacterized protein n=1 Tax=Tetrahymena thermophila (strain SB210) TaxID=312017 RepID=Q24CE9_TETTS|nr:hypothetical protein TTHERM_01078030 [Tetrahymena thermophila SB210]EAS05425.1 hypothetical protein TTHERM_01078030 [Tetrahymena thermophila SB210]|eukprot:XP_001025670.1 hypothetical protein TTHERM_01078030 [Tetrahymena thermophila SB210]